MVSNVSGNGNTFGVLTQKLEERKKALESLNAQKEAVLTAIDNNDHDIQYREGITADDKNKLAEYVVLHQNLKAPDVVNDPGEKPVQGDYNTTDADGNSVADTDSYNTAVDKWQKDKQAYDQYQKDLEDYNNQKAALEAKINEYQEKGQENEDFLKNLNDIAAEKEQELIRTQGGIDVNTGDVERLNKEITQMGQEGISFGVENSDSDGYYAAVQRQFKALQDAGIIPADAEQGDFTPQELAKLANKLVELDKANGTVGENDTGMSRYYRTMQGGESYGNYSLDQINELLEASGAGSLNLNESFGSVSMDDLDKMGDNYAETSFNNRVSTEITLPRGVDLPEGTTLAEGEKPTLGTYGFVAEKQPDGSIAYKKDGKTYTAEQVNDEFRKMETEQGGKHYQETLAEAEKMGVDPSVAEGAEDKNKVLKKAIKAKEKEIEETADKKYDSVKNDENSSKDDIAKAKAEKKYAVQIYRYGIDTEKMTADDIKNAVAKGEYCEKHADDIKKYDIDTSKLEDKDAVKKAINDAKAKAKAKTEV